MSHPASFHRPDKVLDPLYVITPIFNPQRYRTRWKHYLNFEKQVLDSGAHLITIEASFGERQEVLTQTVSDKHTIINIRTSQEIWLKENMINLAISRLPSNWKYVAWIDADIQFIRPDWVGETLQQLQHYQVVQMFSEAHDTDSNFEVIQTHKGFIWCYQNLDSSPTQMGKSIPAKSKDGYSTEMLGKTHYWHPGFAWAARKEAINNLGGLIDWSILGGGDTFMAWALIGELNNRNMPRSLGESGVRLLQEWQERAEKFVKRNVGHIEGGIYHFWHGSRKSRRYEDRGAILTGAQFNPEKDLYRDWQGLYQINPDNIKLRDGARKYFRSRNEDQISD